jgi:hypothetical protein
MVSTQQVCISTVESVVLLTVYIAEMKEGMDFTKEEYMKCLQVINGALPGQ